MERFTFASSLARLRGRRGLRRLRGVRSFDGERRLSGVMTSSFPMFLVILVYFGGLTVVHRIFILLQVFSIPRVWLVGEGEGP